MFDGKIDTKHVGKTIEQLKARLARETTIEYASSFKNLETANKAQMQFIKSYEKEITEWLKSNEGQFKRKLELGTDLGKIVGRGKFGTKIGTKIEVVRAKTQTGNNWFIVTSYPTP